MSMLVPDQTQNFQEYSMMNKSRQKTLSVIILSGSVLVSMALPLVAAELAAIAGS